MKILLLFLIPFLLNAKTAQELLNEIQLGNSSLPAYELANIYKDGNNEVSKNCKLAGYFYFLALKNGVCESYKDLSNMYKFGDCLKKDLEKSNVLRIKYSECMSSTKELHTIPGVN